MKKFLMSFMCVGMCMVALPANAQTVDTAAIIARMEAIIAEMNTLKAEFESLSTSVQTTAVASEPVGAVLGAATTALQEEVVYGETNDTIAKVQRLLATDPLIYAYGVSSGFFGPKTEDAIRAFQSRFGLDPVGVMGPATSALILEFYVAYPDENYPTDVLKSRPTVQTTATPAVAGAATSNTATVADSSNPLASIAIEEDDDEFYVTLRMTNGDSKLVVASDDSEDSIVTEILRRTDLTEAQVLARLDLSTIDYETSSRRSSDADEDDAEDAIDDAKDAIDDADDEIDEAKDDDEETDKAEDLLDEAEDLFDEAEEALEDEDYDEAVEKAEEAEEKARDAEDAIGERDNDGEIDEIEADVEKNEARIDVEFEDGDDDRFTVEEDDREDIIAEVADELDISESEVEDLITFDFGDIESIIAERDGGRTLVTIEYESGVKEKFVTDEEDEDDIVDDIVDELDLDEDEVERAIDVTF